MVLLLLWSQLSFAIMGSSGEVSTVILSWHKAASEHDETKYFSMFAKDAVFLGTDPTERWTKEEFRKWAHPIFAKGRGWTIVSKKRNIRVSEDDKTAWFDEEADSKELGLVRGSGVLVREDGSWKVAQYNLSYPVLNERFDDIKKINIPKAKKKK